MINDYGPSFIWFEENNADLPNGGRYCHTGDVLYPDGQGEIYYIEPQPGAPRSMALFYVEWIFPNVGGASANLRFTIIENGVQVEELNCDQTSFVYEFWVLGCVDLSSGITSFVAIDVHTNTEPTRAAYGCV